MEGIKQSQYEINGTYQLSKSKTSDRVSGSLSLHAYLHLPDPSYIEGLISSSTITPLTPSVIDIKKLSPLKKNGWMDPGSGMSSGSGVGTDPGSGTRSIVSGGVGVGVEMCGGNSVGMRRNSSPTGMTSKLSNTPSHFSNSPVCPMPAPSSSGSDVRVGEDIGKLRDQKGPYCGSNTEPDPRSEDLELDSSIRSNEWDEDENENILEDSFAKGSPKLTESPDRKLFRVRPAVSSFLLHGNYSHGMHVKSKAVRTLQSASSIESLSLSGSGSGSSLCIGQCELEDGGSKRLGLDFDDNGDNENELEFEIENENEGDNRNKNKNRNYEVSLVQVSSSESKQVLERSSRGDEERDDKGGGGEGRENDDWLEESFSSCTTVDIIPKKKNDNNVRNIINNINENVNNNNSNNNNSNHNNNSNNNKIQRNKLLIRPSSSNGLLNINRQSMLEGVSKCLNGLSLAQDDTNDMIKRMREKLEIRKSARASKIEILSLNIDNDFSNTNLHNKEKNINLNANINVDKKINETHDVNRKLYSEEDRKKKLISEEDKMDKKTKINASQNGINNQLLLPDSDSESNNTNFHIKKDEKENYQKTIKPKNSFKNVYSSTDTSAECSTEALNPFRNILEKTKQINNNNCNIFNSKMTEKVDEENDADINQEGEDRIENYDSFCMESDPGSLDSTEMIVISSSGYTVTTSSAGVARVSSCPSSPR